MIPRRKIAPLTYCSVSCVCPSCLDEDSRLSLITTNGWLTDVVIGR